MVPTALALLGLTWSETVWGAVLGGSAAAIFGLIHHAITLQQPSEDEGTKKPKPSRTWRRITVVAVGIGFFASSFAVSAAQLSAPPPPPLKGTILEPSENATVPSLLTVSGTTRGAEGADLYLLILHHDSGQYGVSERVVPSATGAWSTSVHVGDQNARDQSFLLILGAASPDTSALLRAYRMEAEARCDFRGFTAIPAGFVPLDSQWVRRGEYVDQPALLSCLLPHAPARAEHPYANVLGVVRSRNGYVVTGDSGNLGDGYLHVIQYEPSADAYWAHGRLYPNETGAWTHAFDRPGNAAFSLTVGVADSQAHGEIMRWVQRNTDRDNWTAGLEDYPSGFTPLNAKRIDPGALSAKT